MPSVYVTLSTGYTESWLDRTQGLDNGRSAEITVEPGIGRRWFAGVGVTTIDYPSLRSTKIYVTVSRLVGKKLHLLYRGKFGYSSVRDNTQRLTSGPLFGFHTGLLIPFGRRINLELGSDLDFLFLSDGMQGQTGGRMGFILGI